MALLPPHGGASLPAVASVGEHHRVPATAPLLFAPSSEDDAEPGASEGAPQASAVSGATHHPSQPLFPASSDDEEAGDPKRPRLRPSRLPDQWKSDNHAEAAHRARPVDPPHIGQALQTREKMVYGSGCALRK